VHRLVLYRAFDGDVSYVKLGVRDLWGIAAAVLGALEVLHGKGMVHLDVKPHNVLWRGDAPPHGAPDKSGGGGMSFVLGDYGVMASAAATFRNAVRGGGPSGTDGYISPLLLADDEENDVFPAFQRVATMVSFDPLVGTSLDAVWGAYFKKHRVQEVGDICKADLHSLALTLLQLARTNDLVLGKALVEFLGRLMFFRPDDHFTAANALAEAARH
jgi:serine/threonine protein kinase